MRRSSIVLLAAVAALLLAAPAQAGTYEVRACSVQGAKYPNRSWTFSVPDGTLDDRVHLSRLEAGARGS